jgi:2,3-diketo-5-methylthio-1-phosphopentane phosphatase
MLKPLRVFCDFDGTITTCDTTDYLLESLADIKWKEIEAQWQEGEIGSRECMAKQIPLIRGGWNAVQQALDNVRLEPSFVAFHSWCRKNQIPVYVVSDGLDRVIKYLLNREEIIVDAIFANHLEDAEDGSLRLTFNPNQPCLSGVCKCALLGELGQGFTKVIIGDGQSDFCWCKEADLLFAKHKLATYCESEKIPFYSFASFTDIKAELVEHVRATKPAIPLFGRVFSLANRFST